MLQIRKSRPEDGARVMQIWCAAVDATHDFLTPADRQELEFMLADYLPTAPLWLAVDEDDVAAGFMLLDQTHMEALFIHPDWRGRGVGRLLVDHGLSLAPAMTTDVNEQNGQAIGFYRRMGFVPTGRSDTDDAGRPYPLIHLTFAISAEPRSDRADTGTPRSG